MPGWLSIVSFDQSLALNSSRVRQSNSKRDISSPKCYSYIEHHQPMINLIAIDSSASDICFIFFVLVGSLMLNAKGASLS